MHVQARNETMVLIVDDEYLIRQTLKEALELDGYAVMTAQNGRHALQVMHDSPAPALILLDLLMPIMGGFDFLERMASDSSMAQIPIVVVSASNDRPNLRGATCCMRKPPDLDVLLQTVAEYTHTSAARTDH